MMWRSAEEDQPGRECWYIILPDGHPDLHKPGHPSQLLWATTYQASSPPHERWDVTGVAPNITVTPSIDILRFIYRDGEFVREGSYWHGFITNGEFISAG